MCDAVLKLDSRDNVLIALRDLRKCEQVSFAGTACVLRSDVPAKHKFAAEELGAGSPVKMYGVVVGTATQPIHTGEIVTARNLRHETCPYQNRSRQSHWTAPDANVETREPCRLSHLCAGLKCGGSDGFSGISANPAIGRVSDILTALGARTILSEFPELCGVEQELIDRGVNDQVAGRFIQLMKDYAARAKAVRSGLDMNPSPGNIRDGIVTDAMKSAGAARKGGTSPITAVLDYPEYCAEAGLNLQCTPGNDVEWVTAQVGAGANAILFTTGLGTPTGNPVAPVIKISTNSDLAQRMRDIIDVDAGPIVSGERTVDEMGDAILEFLIRVVNGEIRSKAEMLGQDDCIPWKRGVSL